VYDFDIYVALTAEPDEVLRAWGYRLLLRESKTKCPKLREGRTIQLLVIAWQGTSEHVRLHLAGAIACSTMRRMAREA